MDKLAANELSKFNMIRECRDEKNIDILSGFLRSTGSDFLRVEALLARAFVYLSDGQDSIALEDLKAARRLAPGNVEVRFLAELIEGRQFVPSYNLASPSVSHLPNGRPPSNSSANSYPTGSAIASGDALSQTPISMSTLSLNSGSQTPVQNQPQPVQPAITTPASRSVLFEDFEIQRQQSLFKLDIVKGEVHKDKFSLAYDRPLIQLLQHLATVRGISFSVRSKHPVMLKSVRVFDSNGNSCRSFFIKEVDFYSYAPQKKPVKSEICRNFYWENREVSHHEVIVCKMVFQGLDPPLQGNKAEGYIVFYFSNNDYETKIWQMISANAEEFYAIKHNKISIEAYSAPIMPQKNRNILSPNQTSDKFYQDLEKRYPFSRSNVNECPNVRDLNVNNYKTSIHQALFLEEAAHVDALADLCLQKIVLVQLDRENFRQDFETCGEVFFPVSFKCPFTVSEESDRGLALMNIATFVMISRMQDWDSSNPNVNVLKADIIRKFFLTEIEQYSHLQLKKEFRNLHFIIKIHQESFAKIFADASVGEMWHIEFGFDRFNFVECHFATDQIRDPSVLFASKNQLSPQNEPPWYMLSRAHANEEDEHATQQTQIRKGIFEIRDRYMFSSLLQRQQDACEAAFHDCKGRFYPPVVVHGPFGTGKTHTLSEATKLILESRRNVRILICVVSRNTGNFYHQKLVDQKFGDRCLRLFGRNEDISHVDPHLLEQSNVPVGRFLYPTKDHAKSKAVIIVSLEAAMVLHRIGMTSTDFTHVFIDEAAQVAEFHLAPVLAFANKNNRVVMTGDTMQLNPELLSVSVSQNFGHSILERFSRLVYTKPCGFSFGLDVNYRSNGEIAQFAYRHFYPSIHYVDHYGDVNSDDTPIPGVGRLMFVSVRGLQSLHDQLASRCNWVEADKVARVLHKLVREIRWDIRSKDIGIITAFKGQVQAIRDKAMELNIDSDFYDVDTVRNMQGRQYRVIIVSLVTDVETASSTFADPIKRENDLGFVTDRKLVCTALTRAISSVIVVGDSIPLLLYPDAECFKVWDDFKNVTFQNDNFKNEDRDALERRLRMTREDHDAKDQSGGPPNPM